VTPVCGGIHDGDVTLKEDGDVTGIVDGTIVIEPGLRTRISGIVKGGVVVGKDADVLISGIVKGGVRNDGGSVTITGLVSD